MHHPSAKSDNKCTHGIKMTLSHKGLKITSLAMMECIMKEETGMSMVQAAIQNNSTLKTHSLAMKYTIM